MHFAPVDAEVPCEWNEIKPRYYLGRILQGIASNNGPERRKIHSYLKERKDKGVLDSQSRTVEYKDLNKDKQIDIEIRIHGYLKEGKIKEC